MRRTSRAARTLHLFALHSCGSLTSAAVPRIRLASGLTRRMASSKPPIVRRAELTDPTRSGPPEHAMGLVFNQFCRVEAVSFRPSHDCVPQEAAIATPERRVVLCGPARGHTWWRSLPQDECLRGRPANRRLPRGAVTSTPPLADLPPPPPQRSCRHGCDARRDSASRHPRPTFRRRVRCVRRDAADRMPVP